MLLTCIKGYLVLNTNFHSFESGHFTQVLLAVLQKPKSAPSATLGVQCYETAFALYRFFITYLPVNHKVFTNRLQDIMLKAHQTTIYLYNFV